MRLSGVCRESVWRCRKAVWRVLECCLEGVGRLSKGSREVVRTV